MHDTNLRGTTENHMKAELIGEIETEMADLLNTIARTRRRDMIEMIVLIGESAVIPVEESMTDHKGMRDSSGATNAEETGICVTTESKTGMVERDVLMTEETHSNPIGKGTHKMISQGLSSSTEMPRETKGTRDPAEIPRKASPLGLLNLTPMSKSGSLNRTAFSQSNIPPGKTYLNRSQLPVPKSSKLKASTHPESKDLLVLDAEAVGVNDVNQSVGSAQSLYDG